MSPKSVFGVTEGWFLEILAMVDGQFLSRSQTQLWLQLNRFVAGSKFLA